MQKLLTNEQQVILHSLNETNGPEISGYHFCLFPSARGKITKL